MLLLGPAARADDAESLFTARIAPLLERHCVACHNADKLSGGLDLTTRASLLKGGESGTEVVPGAPEQSLLVEMVSGEEPQMPMAKATSSATGPPKTAKDPVYCYDLHPEHFGDRPIPGRGTAWGVVALLAAFAGTGGSVYLSIGLGLKACPLCFYQRSFIMTAALVLMASLWLDGLHSPRACIVALPLACSGLAVAAFHEYLVLSGKLECPSALFGWGDGPAQSLGAFTALTTVCLGGAWSGRRAAARQGLLTIVGAALVGFGMAWLCIASAPPLPPRPPQPYDPAKQPFDMCRPPFSGV